MTTLAHTYGHNCRLAPVSEPPDSDAFDDTPQIKAQFFYTSVLPIDDPLSHGTLASASDPKSIKGRMRPFALGDNNALERAWLSLISREDGIVHQEARIRRKLGPVTTKANSERLARLVRGLAAQHFKKHGAELPSLSTPTLDSSLHDSAPASFCCTELYLDTSSELQNAFCALARTRQDSLGQDNVMQAIMMRIRHLQSAQQTSLPPDALNAPSHHDGRAGVGSSPIASASMPMIRPNSSHADLPQPGAKRLHSSSPQAFEVTTPQQTLDTAVYRPAVDDGISGKPFVRVGSPKPVVDADPTSLSTRETSDVSPTPSPTPTQRTVDIENTRIDVNSEAIGLRREIREVAVGISRLHMVSVPLLQMKPIYWSPVNDVAVVMRATWFYRDTMTPVPPDVANQLEAGYRELRPFAQTWRDELRCAIEVGPLGEEKISHRLWPARDDAASRDKLATEDTAISTDPFCAARCFHGEAAAQGSIDPDPGSDPSIANHKSFSSYHVIYKDANSAFLLKPSLKPSAYYGRRPVAKIMKGMTIGIPVLRGFDREAWQRLHDKKTMQKDTKQPQHASTNDTSGLLVCPACKAQNDRGQVTDLILVCHGIGQKFAERVESFHFTHAINAFRREVNMELGNPCVQGVLREGQNGIMVLPVNWRHTLKFEDGGPLTDGNKSTHGHDGFGLKDIEPNTIPAVRSMISDIMFDIPFYMSHHKSKMIEALVKEANRVYRLWCRNNPGFHDSGRVHLIGHSLGSAMAVDILSRQPNRPPKLNLESPMLQASHFDFDTTNLFLVGSPAAFFLLLERGALMPRRGRLKPGADAGDVHARNVTGEAGTFGCLAVDNIYNILAKEDPIAYLLNGTIDPTYAGGLKTAFVPSTAVSLFKYVGDSMRSVIPGVGAAAPATDVHTTKPGPIRLPSQLELEVHDFTREELAERKAFLLNDNGQVDYYLHSGGGPLEMQYLNMLSAHSSYWASRDFIRMLCIEVGRRPGRDHSTPAMKAQKATKRIVRSTIG